MSEEMIIKHCSPTLAGIKTGNMFTCPYKSDGELRASLCTWNKALAKKGLRILPLKCADGKAIIYIYRRSRLAKDLSDKAVCDILRGFGYDDCTPEKCVARLKKRVSDSTGREFPHEIGLFLGYPPEDVLGFIENKAGRFKCAGAWKVYGDASAAEKAFARYKKCTALYCRQYANGSTVERLTVAR